MIVHIGANLISDISPRDLLHDLSQMYKTIRNMFPNTTIFNSAMIPRKSDEFLYALKIINEEVELYIRTLRIKTISHLQFGTNTINYNLLKHDKVHPTKAGTILRARNMIAIYRNYRNSAST